MNGLQVSEYETSPAASGYLMSENGPGKIILNQIDIIFSQISGLEDSGIGMQDLQRSFRPDTRVMILSSFAGS